MLVLVITVMRASKALNPWVLALSLVLFLWGMNQGGPSKKQESKLLTIENKIKQMGLKHSHVTRQSKASWYGGYFHGRRTANMETFDKNILSAAHKSLPLNTYLLVTNLENGRKTIVRVNDRGPYIHGRELDLSEAAAKILGSHSKGVVKVQYEILQSA